MNQNEPSPELISDLTKQLLSEGKLIEAGWQELRELTLSHNAPEIQVKEMRKSFFAGAQHLFASIMTILDPEAEPTDDDMRRMQSIHEELDGFAVELRSELGMIKIQPRILPPFYVAGFDDPDQQGFAVFAEPVKTIDEIKKALPNPLDPRPAFILYVEEGKPPTRLRQWDKENLKWKFFISEKLD